MASIFLSQSFAFLPLLHSNNQLFFSFVAPRVPPDFPPSFLLIDCTALWSTAVDATHFELYKVVGQGGFGKVNICVRKPLPRNLVDAFSNNVKGKFNSSSIDKGGKTQLLLAMKRISKKLISKRIPDVQVNERGAAAGRKPNPRLPSVLCSHIRVLGIFSVIPHRLLFFCRTNDGPRVVADCVARTRRDGLSRVPGALHRGAHARVSG